MERNKGDHSHKLQILGQKEDVFAFYKPAGMPVQKDKSDDLDLWSIACDMTNKRLHLVNRLDRPVSGVVLLTPSKKTYHHLQKVWQSQIDKTYLAITEGNWKQKEGKLHNFLKKGHNNKAIEYEKGKEAILYYRQIYQLERYSLVEVKLVTGRFHQIRAQLYLAGHPIKGDVKYGARRRNKDRKIHLHAYKIKVKETTFVAPLPIYDNLWKLVSNVL